MKKILLMACAATLSLSACASPLTTGSSTTTTATTSTTTSDNPLSGLGKLLGGSSSSSDNTGSGIGNIISSVISNVLGTDKITASSLVGTWNYAGPAVCFQSENLLQKAGGAAMATTIENKLSGYYDKFGINKMTLTVDEDQNFQLNFGVLKTTGTISIEDDDVYFNFTALGAISLGKMKTYVTMSGTNQMSLMFDVTKLMNILTAVASSTGNSTLSTVSSLLGSYDGLCAGFKLTK